MPLPTQIQSQTNFLSFPCQAKAVVWTDVIQIMIMYGTLILINVMGTFNVGGLSVVIDRNVESGRLSVPEYVN